MKVNNHRFNSLSRHKVYQRKFKAEITTKFVANFIISLAAILTCFRLLPHYFLQQNKLREVRVEVEETQHRVWELKDEVARSFDTQHKNKIMQEQSSRVAKDRLKVYWVENTN